MQTNYLRFFCFVFFVCFSLFFHATSCYSKTYEIYDIGIINIIGVDYANDILKVQFQYLDRDKGTWVHWDKKSVDCNCQVYPLTNDQKMNQRSIASTRKFLENYKQLLFIDIPRNDVKNFQYVRIECEFSIGWNIIKAEGNFEFR